ncbi:hypothetical protein GMSM_46340 [Geomonas sp. Red276]
MCQPFVGIVSPEFAPMLDPAEEKALAEEGMAEELEKWPEY